METCPSFRRCSVERLFAESLSPSHLQRSGHLSANARALGSTQLGRLQSHDHSLMTEGGGGYGRLVFADFGQVRSPWQEVAPANFNDQAAIGFRVATAETGGAETRPVNVAFSPRIQI